MLWQGFVLVLSGAFLLALFQVISKKMLIKKAPADCISTIMFIGAGILLFLLSFQFMPPQIESWFEWPNGLFWPLAVTSLLNIVILFGTTRALAHADVSLVGPISAAQPMFVIIPSMLVLGEVPDTGGYVGLLLLAVGIYFFSFAEKVKGWECPHYLLWLGSYARYLAPWMMLFRNRGVRIALLVAACGAVSINFDKLSMLRSSALFAPACIVLFCGIVGLIKIAYTGEYKAIQKEHVLHLVLNTLIYTLVIVFFWWAFHFGFAAYVGALKRFSVIFALILAYLLLGEEGVKKRWPGALIMTAGAALLSL